MQDDDEIAHPHVLLELAGSRHVSTTGTLAGLSRAAVEFGVQT